jgi:hypothetical protein
MLALVGIAASIGAALALRLNILALITTTLFLLAIVGTGLVVRGDPIWQVAVILFATATSSQLGYLGASLLIGMRTSVGQIDPEAPPLAPCHPDRDSRPDDQCSNSPASELNHTREEAGRLV